MQQTQGLNQQPLEEHYVFQIELLSKTIDDTYSELLSDFPSLSDFDDKYSCEDCTNTNLCSVCAEIEAALQVDTFPINEVVNEALDIPAAPTKHSIEQPPSEPLPEDLYYSSKLQFEQEEKLSQEHKKGNGWTLVDIPNISPSMILHRVSIEREDETKVVRQPLNLLISSVVEKKITCPFDTFTYRRFFFDPGIKGEGTNENFKVNVYHIKLLHESPTLEEENVEDLSLGKAAYVITYPP